MDDDVDNNCIFLLLYVNLWLSVCLLVMICEYANNVCIMMHHTDVDEFTFHFSSCLFSVFLVLLWKRMKPSNNWSMQMDCSVFPSKCVLSLEKAEH